MANTYVDRAMMTTATTGTGTITLGSAVPGYQSFATAGLTTGQTVRYCIQDVSNTWEIGIGTYTTSGTTLTRGATESSNSGSAISLSGSATVFITIGAADLSLLATKQYVDTAMQHIRISLTSAQILNLYTTPILLVAAPPAGQYILIMAAGWSVVFNTIAYSSTAVTVQWGSVSTAVGLPAASVATTTSQMTFNRSLALSVAPSSITGIGLTITSPSNPTTGNGTINLDLWYSIGTA